MQDWTKPEQWLAGITGRVGQWVADGRFPPADAAKLLSLVALRQHQNGFAEAVAATLAELEKLQPPISGDVLWISDAARMTGNSELAAEFELALLDERRLPIVRIAALMAETAALRGSEAALEIAEKAADFTWEREFLETVTGIARAAGDSERSAVWHDRHLQVLALEPNPQRFGFVVGLGGAGKLYQFAELAREPQLSDYIGGQLVEIHFDPDKRFATATSGEETIGVDVVDSAQWRKANPEGEVYLVSALEWDEDRLIEFGADDWRFTTSLDLPGWMGESFNDFSWKLGKAPLGFGKPDPATKLPPPVADAKQHQPSYFRRSVEIGEPGTLAKLAVRIRCVDGAVIYWNGEEIHRHNMPEGEIEAETTALKAASGKEAELFLIPVAKCKTGANILAVAIHRHAADGKNLYFDLDLTAIPKEAQE